MKASLSPLSSGLPNRVSLMVLGEAKGLDLLSDEHFTVDGTLLEACASRFGVGELDVHPFRRGL